MEISWIKLTYSSIVQFDVYNLLSTNADLDCWITWLKGIVHRFLRIPTHQRPHGVSDIGALLFDAYDGIHLWFFLSKANDPNDYTFYAKEFIFKWTYLTALLIKDLSASHASSEGKTLRRMVLSWGLDIHNLPPTESFRIMQSFFDDLVLYLVEQKLSKMAFDWHSSQESAAASPPLPRFPATLSVKRSPSSISGNPFILSSGSNENTGVIARLAEPPTDANDKPPFEAEIV